MIKCSSTNKQASESTFGGKIMEECKSVLSEKFELVNVINMTHTCNALARDMKTSAVNGIKQNFHNDLSKFVSSTISIEMFKFRFSNAQRPEPKYKTKYSKSSFIRRTTQWLQ